MADQVAIQIPKTRWPEGSAFQGTVNFRDRATGTASTPSSVKYRIDCLTTGKEIRGWTTMAAASTATVSVTASDNELVSQGNSYERRQLTISADHDASGQHRGTVVWRVENIRGVR